MSQKFYNLKQISQLLITPIPFLRKIIKEEKLKAHYIGKQYIVSEEDLKHYIDSLGIKNVR